MDRNLSGQMNASGVRALMDRMEGERCIQENYIGCISRWLVISRKRMFGRKGVGAVI